MPLPRASDDIQDLRRLARWLDSEYRLPGGVRIGWDGILGFIPGLGDFITNLISFYIMARAAALGCSPSVILRMGLNVLIDNLVDLVPVLGNFFDIFWKANTRNMDLVESYVADPRRTVRSSRAVVFLTLLLVALALAATAAMIVAVAVWVWSILVQWSQNAAI